MQTYPNLTDVHATQDEPLMIRAGGALKKLRETAGEDFFTALFTSYVNEDRMTAYKKEGALDTAFSLGNTRFRLHIYKSGGKPAAAIRVLPELSALPADPDKAFLDKLSALEHGLVLITGPSGSGKSTTLAHILLTAVAKRPPAISSPSKTPSNTSFPLTKPSSTRGKSEKTRRALPKASSSP